MEDRAQTIERRQRIAANMVAVSRWVTRTTAECECPMGHNNAWLYIDGRAFIHCFHNSCRAACLELSGLLADEFGDDGCSTPENDEEMKRLRAWRKELRSFEVTAKRRILPGILDEPDVPTSGSALI